MLTPTRKHVDDVRQTLTFEATQTINQLRILLGCLIHATTAQEIDQAAQDLIDIGAALQFDGEMLAGRLRVADCDAVQFHVSPAGELSAQPTSST